MIVVHCAGTATDVGKTWFGAATLAALRRRGLRVAARKPVQSFDAGDDAPTDAEVLAAATGEPIGVVCPPGRSYEVPMAPPMAADVLGRGCPSVAELVAIERPDVDVLWVEGVGGPRSPVASDGDGVDLARALAPDVVVLVADAGLGTINAVVLSVEALGMSSIVALNRYDDADDLHRRNRAWLVERCGMEVVTSSAELAERLITRSGGSGPPASRTARGNPDRAHVPVPRAGRRAQYGKLRALPAEPRTERRTGSEPVSQPAAATPPPGGTIDLSSR